MFSISEYPFVRISILFIIGILFADYYSLSNSQVLILLGTSFLFITNKKNSVKGLGFYISLISLGAFSFNNYYAFNKKININSFINNEIQIKGTIGKNIINKENYTQFTLENIILYNNHQFKEIPGKLLVKSKLDLSVINPTDEIYLNTIPTEIPDALFPNTFNYKEYLKRENTLAAGILNENEFNIKVNHSFSISKTSYKIKQKIISFFNIYLPTDQSALAIALITGEDAFVNSSIIEAFKNTGTMHLLAVSGMHVGLIFIVLSHILKPFRRNKRLDLIFDSLIISTIWVFCFIAGLSDSVVRAGTMLTFTIFGHMLNKKSNNINAIFASIFIMILLKPTYIYNPGFQLSLSAVLGIQFFYKHIIGLYSSKYRVVNLLIDSTALSIAAQIGTLPITLYYFNQFPNWFLLSNTILIPLSTILIYSCIFLLIISPIKVFSIYISKIVCLQIDLFIKTINYLNKLPYQLIDHISFNKIQTFLLFIIILISYWIIHFKKLNLIKTNLIACVLFLAISIFNKIEQLNAKETVVVNHKKYPYIIEICGDKAYVIGTPNNNYVKTNINNYLMKKGVVEISSISINDERHFHFKNNCFINEKGIFRINIEKKKKYNNYSISSINTLKKDSVNFLVSIF